MQQAHILYIIILASGNSGPELFQKKKANDQLMVQTQGARVPTLLSIPLD